MKILILIQKLYFGSITFQFMYANMAEQSCDRMIPANKDSRIAAHMPGKLKENILIQLIFRPRNFRSSCPEALY